MNTDYFFRKIKDVSFKDCLAVIPMICALMIRPFFSKKYKNTWLICEEKTEARDNGYHFFKYLCKEQPQQDCYYAIATGCKDWKKIKDLGKTVEYGSIMHWILYFTSQYNISSQKGGKPNAALCSFFELNNIFKPRNVFLQHGVTKDKNDWLMAEKCRFECFITATTSEHEFVKQAFGYKPEIIHLTGFPRFDNLHDGQVIPNRIIIMPTWRKWLRLRSEKNRRPDNDIKTSEFLDRWLELLNNQALDEMINEYKLEIVFYPHRAMQPYIGEFRKRVNNDKIIIASVEEYDMQELMKSASLMITDYSSVYFDMFYMKKPVIFYQFDEEDFRRFHYEEGWFNYHSNPFGQTYNNCRDVLTALEKYIISKYRITDIFREAHNKEFAFFDTKNSERIYRILEKN